MYPQEESTTNVEADRERATAVIDSTARVRPARAETRKAAHLQQRSQYPLPDPKPKATQVRTTYIPKGPDSLFPSPLTPLPGNQRKTTFLSVKRSKGKQRLGTKYQTRNLVGLQATAAIGSTPGDNFPPLRYMHIEKDSSNNSKKRRQGERRNYCGKGIERRMVTSPHEVGFHRRLSPRQSLVCESKTSAWTGHVGEKKKKLFFG